MTTLLRRIASLEAVLQRRTVPGPGLSGLLRYAADHQPSEAWWQELGQIVAESPYQDALRAQESSGLGLLLQEALRWREAQG